MQAILVSPSGMNVSIADLYWTTGHINYIAKMERILIEKVSIDETTSSHAEIIRVQGVLKPTWWHPEGEEWLAEQSVGVCLPVRLQNVHVGNPNNTLLKYQAGEAEEEKT